MGNACMSPTLATSTERCEADQAKKLSYPRNKSATAAGSRDKKKRVVRFRPRLLSVDQVRARIALTKSEFVVRRRGQRLFVAHPLTVTVDEDESTVWRATCLTFAGSDRSLYMFGTSDEFFDVCDADKVFLRPMTELERYGATCPSSDVETDTRVFSLHRHQGGDALIRHHATGTNLSVDRRGYLRLDASNRRAPSWRIDVVKSNEK